MRIPNFVNISIPVLKINNIYLFNNDIHANVILNIFLPLCGISPKPLWFFEWDDKLKTNENKQTVKRKYLT